MNKWLKLICLMVLATGYFVDADASYVFGVTITRAYIAGEDGYVYFGTSTQPSGTCNYYTSYFRFDSTTPIGKNQFAMLLAAKASGKTIEVWYFVSTAPGTTEANGCTVNSMALVDSLGVDP